MPTGGVMSARANPTRPRDCGVPKGSIVLLKERPGRVEERPADGVDGEDTCEQRQNEGPIRGLGDDITDHEGKDPGPDIPAHVHDADHNTDAAAAEINAHRIAADAAEG